MPKLITRCLSEDYQFAIDDHSDRDRGNLSIEDFCEALHSVSYAMPHSHDPESSHRPSVGVIVAGASSPTFFYVTSYQGEFGLSPNYNSEFNSDDLIDVVNGDKTIEELRIDKTTTTKKVKLLAYLLVGFIGLGVIYYATR